MIKCLGCVNNIYVFFLCGTAFNTAVYSVGNLLEEVACKCCPGIVKSLNKNYGIGIDFANSCDYCRKVDIVLVAD